MTLLALTQDNIDFLKRDLKPSYTSVISSHLSEAIAAACGFRTNIAMVTSLREADPRRPDLAEVDDVRFLSRLTELGYSALDGAVLPGLVRSQQIPQRIWFARKGQGIAAVNLWYRECQQRDIPYVYITTRRTLAQVDWDHMALDKKHDKVLDRDVREEMFRTFQLIARGGTAKPYFNGKALVGTVNDLPIEIAPALADAIFRILYQAICEGERQAA